MIQEERGLLNGFVSSSAMLIRHAHAGGMGQTEFLMLKLSAICTSLFTFSTYAFYTDFTNTLWLCNDVH